MHAKRVTQLSVSVVCFAVLGFTLSLGLWPFHAPHNEVTWLNRANGVSLGKYGAILSSDHLQSDSSHKGASGSIEIWIQPEEWRNSATLLTFYEPKMPLIFALRQRLEDLEVYAEIEGKSGSLLEEHLYVDDALGRALRRNQPIFLAVTSGSQGTRVYVDGGLVKAAPGFWITNAGFTGRLILGDAPEQPDSFRGKIFGVAIYAAELGARQVSRHFRTWTLKGSPEITPDENNSALYLFDERSGRTVHNYAGGGCDLHIPEVYTVVDKLSLQPFWKEFNFSRSYWRGNIKNVVGFVPLGACWFLYFLVVRLVKKPERATIILGASVSLTIESLQGFLPTRDSGTTDLFTNTLGSYLGVLCGKYLHTRLQEVLRAPKLTGC